MRNRNVKTLDNILREIYSELYKNSTPSADFEELAKNAPWVENVNGINIKHENISDEEAKRLGYKKFINFDDYKISEKEYDRIVEEIYDKYKLNKHDRKMLDFNVYLGCGPSTIKEDNENYEVIENKENEQ